VTDPACADCRHFYPGSRDPGNLVEEPRGECRQGPPQLTLLPGPQGVLQLVGYPAFKSSEVRSCDQFAPRAEPEADPDTVSAWWNEQLRQIRDARRQGNDFAANCLLDDVLLQLRNAGRQERRQLVEGLLGMVAPLDRAA
jgi:hypothetical protein